MGRPKKVVSEVSEVVEPVVETVVEPVAEQTAEPVVEKKVLKSPVLLLTRGSFSLYEVEGGYEVRTNLRQLVAKCATMEEGEKLLRGLTR